MNYFFASNLKYLRETRGIEQMDLAKMLGKKSASSISEWESGKYTPKIGILSDIARIFGIKLDELMYTDLTSSIPKSTSNQIPLLGNIAAGTPIIAEENIEEYISLDSKIKADFALRVKGDSMINANIFDNDIVFIKKQDVLENGEIGAILIEDEATLKRFSKVDDIVILTPENPNMSPRKFTNCNMKILGKLVATLRIN